MMPFLSTICVKGNPDDNANSSMKKTTATSVRNGSVKAATVIVRSDVDKDEKMAMVGKENADNEVEKQAVEV